MQTVKLDVQQLTGAGSAHAELSINYKSVGMLYLTKDELDILSKAFMAADRQSDDFTFGIDEPVQDDQEIDIDIFD